MTDRDVVARAALLLDRAVTPVRARKPHYKTPFVTQIKGVEAVALMRAMRPVLGPDRQKQIDEALQGWAPRRIRSQTRPDRFPTHDGLVEVTADDDRALSWLAGLLRARALSA